MTYPSQDEGFGNAFIEAVYYRRPIVGNRYTIYHTDIEPSGLRPILFDGFISQATVDDVRRSLSDNKFRERMTDHNFEIGRRLFSYQVVEEELRAIIHRLEDGSHLGHF